VCTRGGKPGEPVGPCHLSVSGSIPPPTYRSRADRRTMAVCPAIATPTDHLCEGAAWRESRPWGCLTIRVGCVRLCCGAFVQIGRGSQQLTPVIRMWTACSSDGLLGRTQAGRCRRQRADTKYSPRDSSIPRSCAPIRPCCSSRRNQVQPGSHAVGPARTTCSVSSVEASSCVDYYLVGSASIAVSNASRTRPEVVGRSSGSVITTEEARRWALFGAVLRYDNRNGGSTGRA
jgi:hypothetical protein